MILAVTLLAGAAVMVVNMLIVDLVYRAGPIPACSTGGTRMIAVRRSRPR